MTQPRLILPNTTRRDTLIAVGLGTIVLGCVLWGMMSMSKPHESKNILTGVVMEKQFTPQREEQVSFSGRRIEGAKVIDGEYLLKVRVEAENRVYEVPVERPLYESKSKGDKLEFIRPPSEHR
ncbi:MAG: hypothetical protein QOE70_5147 [Chthoniobacter sp.]|jgi:hypothetical protein|nr:hypothetical protein [Chthoniobacter sp.]